MALSLGSSAAGLPGLVVNALSEILVSHVTNVNPAQYAKKCLEYDTEYGHIRAIGIGPLGPLAGRVNENHKSSRHNL
jgi:hypothetical protein